MKIGSSAKVYYSYFVSSNAGVDQSLENEIYIIIWILRKIDTEMTRYRWCELCEENGDK